MSRSDPLRRPAVWAALAVAFGVLALLLWGARRDERSELDHVRARWQAARERYPERTAAEAGDGGPAAELHLQDPMGLGEDAGGNVYVCDRGRFVWRIDPAGRAEVVAGTGRLGRPAPGGPARDSDLGSPEGLVVAPDGSVYFADSLNDMVLRIRPDGVLERVAGSGRQGTRGDGGPAREAELARPFEVSLDARGNLYVTEYAGHRIRRISPNGVITTVAGTGEPGYAGDGGPAARARLNGPYDAAVDAAGRLVIADSGNHVIRRVAADGTLSTIAGSGRAGYAGDGGPAREARFNSPQCVLPTPEGLYVCDEHNDAVRRIDANGTVSTVAGTGRPGRAPDGAPAATSPLDDPENLWLRADGSLLISDGDNGQVRRVDPQGRIDTFAGAPPAPAGSGPGGAPLAGQRPEP